jgi:hypothetical protein
VSDTCFEVIDMDAVVESIGRGEKPAHLDNCPRCRALVASYRAFMEPPDVPEGSNVPAALAEIRVPGLPPLTGAVPRTPEASRRAPWWSRLKIDNPWLRPVWAIGMAVILVVAYHQLGPNAGHNRPSHVMRGEIPGTPAIVDPLPPARGADGGMVLAWKGVPKADSYLVVFYRADLTEIGRWRVSKQPKLMLPAADSSRLAADGPLYWQIRAIRAQTEIGRSSPLPLLMPGS